MCWGFWGQPNFCPAVIRVNRKKSFDTQHHYKALSPSWSLLVVFFFPAKKLPKLPSRTNYRVHKSSYYRETKFSDNSNLGVWDKNKSKRHQVLICMICLCCLVFPHQRLSLNLLLKHSGHQLSWNALLNTAAKELHSFFFMPLFGWRGGESERLDCS